jgi:hypothetical protein
MADDAMRVKKPSRISMRKTNATVVPTYRSMMVSELSQRAETPAELHPTLCLNVGHGYHHLSVEDEVEMKGIIGGRTAYARIETFQPGEVGNNCSSNSMMVTADLSNLDLMNNDLYAGSLYITITTE